MKKHSTFIGLLLLTLVAWAATYYPVSYDSSTFVVQTPTNIVFQGSVAMRTNTTGQLVVTNNSSIGTVTNGTWNGSGITESYISLSDVTTGNGSTTKHGFVPKGDGNAAHFLDGTLNWSTPAGGGGGSTNWQYATVGDLFATNTVLSGTEKVGTLTVTNGATVGTLTLTGTRQTFSDADATVTANMLQVVQTGTMSAQRTLTLPAASGYTGGRTLTIQDESGSLTTANNIKVLCAGSDTFLDGQTWTLLVTPYSALVLTSNSNNKWQVVSESTQVYIVDVSASPYTWTKNVGCNEVSVICIGGGGKGGGGSGNATTTVARCGGGGGGGGARIERIINPANLPSTVTVTIGSGGSTGGAGGSAAAGTAGQAGGNTTFGAFVFAGGGGGGKGGTDGTISVGGGGGGSATVGTTGTGTTAVAGGSPGASTATAVGGTGAQGTPANPGGNAEFGGGGGSGCSAVPATSTGGSSMYGAGGGGVGGGATTANAKVNGATAGSSGSYSAGTGAAGATVDGGAGTNGADASTSKLCGGGGGGGAGSISTTGGAGGAGGFPGGGGGGGAGGTSVGGAGGAGANGRGYIIVKF